MRDPTPDDHFGSKYHAGTLYKPEGSPNVFGDDHADRGRGWKKDE